MEEWQESEYKEFLDTIDDALSESSAVYDGDNHPGLNILDRESESELNQDAELNIWVTENCRISYNPVEGTYEGMVIPNLMTKGEGENVEKVVEALERSEYEGHSYHSPD